MFCRRRFLKKCSLGCILACLLVVLGGCAEKDRAAVHYPLEEETVMQALREAGLPGEICAEETEKTDNQSVFTLRDAGQPYPDGRARVTAFVLSAALDDGRCLRVIFPGRDGTDAAFDRKTQQAKLAFAERLYFGDAQELALDAALREEEISSGDFELETAARGAFFHMRYGAERGRLELVLCASEEVYHSLFPEK